MKRSYPLFIIDRSKHSSYPFDFIYCDDKEKGFVARIVPFFENATFNEYLNQAKYTEDNKPFEFFRFKNKGGVVLIIEEFKNDEIDITRSSTYASVKSLLKKALKKYLHAEVDRTPHDDLGIENQIKQQALTIERAKQNYEELVKRSNGDSSLAKYQIALAEATLSSLIKFRDNNQFINLN